MTKQETVIWTDGDITPLITLADVTLTLSAGASVAINGNRYVVTSAPEVEIYQGNRYDSRPHAGGDKILVTLKVDRMEI